jgi:hypothetical protein
MSSSHNQSQYSFTPWIQFSDVFDYKGFTLAPKEFVKPRRLNRKIGVYGSGFFIKIDQEYGQLITDNGFIFKDNQYLSKKTIGIYVLSISSTLGEKIYVGKSEPGKAKQDNIVDRLQDHFRKLQQVPHRAECETFAKDNNGYCLNYISKGTELILDSSEKFPVPQDDKITVIGEFKDLKKFVNRSKHLLPEKEIKFRDFNTELLKENNNGDIFSKEFWNEHVKFSILEVDDNDAALIDGYETYVVNIVKSLLDENENVMLNTAKMNDAPQDAFLSEEYNLHKADLQSIKKVINTVLTKRSMREAYQSIPSIGEFSQFDQSFMEFLDKFNYAKEQDYYSHTTHTNGGDFRIASRYKTKGRGGAKNFVVFNIVQGHIECKCSLKVDQVQGLGFQNIFDLQFPMHEPKNIQSSFKFRFEDFDSDKFQRMVEESFEAFKERYPLREPREQNSFT